MLKFRLGEIERQHEAAVCQRDLRIRYLAVKVVRQQIGFGKEIVFVQFGHELAEHLACGFSVLRNTQLGDQAWLGLIEVGGAACHRRAIWQRHRNIGPDWLIGGRGGQGSVEIALLVGQCDIPERSVAAAGLPWGLLFHRRRGAPGRQTIGVAFRAALPALT